MSLEDRILLTLIFFMQGCLSSYSADMLRGVLYFSSSLGERGRGRVENEEADSCPRGRDDCAAAVRGGRKARAKQWTCKEGGLLQLDGDRS